MGSVAGSKGASILSYHYKQRMQGLRRKNHPTLSTALDKTSSNERLYENGKLKTAEDNSRLENNR